MRAQTQTLSAPKFPAVWSSLWGFLVLVCPIESPEQVIFCRGRLLYLKGQQQRSKYGRQRTTHACVWGHIGVCLYGCDGNPLWLTYLWAFVLWCFGKGEPRWSKITGEASRIVVMKRGRMCIAFTAISKVHLSPITGGFGVWHWLLLVMWSVLCCYFLFFCWHFAWCQL